MIIKKTALVERDGTWTFRNTLYAGADAYRSDFISGGDVGCVESECDRAGEQAMPDRTGEGGRCLARRR